MTHEERARALLSNEETREHLANEWRHGRGVSILATQFAEVAAAEREAIAVEIEQSEEHDVFAIVERIRARGAR